MARKKKENFEVEFYVYKTKLHPRITESKVIMFTVPSAEELAALGASWILDGSAYTQTLQKTKRVEHCVHYPVVKWAQLHYLFMKSPYGYITIAIEEHRSAIDLLQELHKNDEIYYNKQILSAQHDKHLAIFESKKQIKQVLDLETQKCINEYTLLTLTNRNLGLLVNE